MKDPVYLSVIVCLLQLPFLATAHVKNEVQHNQAQQLVDKGLILPLDVTLPAVQARCKGKLVDAHLYQQSDKWYYQLQMNSLQGQFIELHIDASNGQPINSNKLPSACHTKAQ
ncbi:PepSY domain-containing protein [Shewanella youngdeokensis]|uniref:PepSY domain-containing protein n=1 Tax=Shewanella youngdeokensis TaxID=2999068 RepID=A0ABZ0JWI5_9GAMM|nr:hypothetical protein RGE70_15145 [Shewanella sp. DAU334]